ncbi:polysaccharide deacetylase family protein [Ornithinibacillus bavariensis]|uniref:polysaccharide deacetylase family protein n=1 Tax=Ornithinibacillus bavariensis TaxID=545502 RepID=UPI000ECDA7DC|nr:polysaccharide deacetylase [Ornithinibacillus sp.]
MKKIFILFSVLLMVSLVACSNSNQSKETKDSQIKDEPKEQISNSNKDSNLAENTENNKGADQEASNHEEANNDKEMGGAVEAAYRIADNWSITPIKEGINEKIVLLTIDDAPDKYALEMARTLKDLDAGAIFFVNGHFLETPENKEILKEIHDMGFIIGNHTYSHAFLPDLTEEEQKNEIMRVNDMVEEIIGERPKFFRAPNGANTDFSKNLVKEEKMVLMNWSYGYDYFKPYMDKEKLTKAMVTGEGPEVDVPYSLLKPGANLLMHDRKWTSEALRDIVVGLREQGYEMVDPHLIETISD